MNIEKFVSHFPSWGIDKYIYSLIGYFILINKNIDTFLSEEIMS